MDNQVRRRSRPDFEGGYDAKLVEKPSPEYEINCPICMLILKDPHQLVTCPCGKNFCKSCITPVHKSNNKKCPVCSSRFDSIVCNFEKKRYLESRKAYCTYKEKGCPWIGELKCLDSHVKDGTSSGCQFFEEICILCSEKVCRGALEEHRRVICPKRQVTCPHCKTYRSDFMDVTYDHVRNCDFFPVECPNSGCTETSIVRKDIEHHLSVCPEEVIKCKFASAGCDIRFQRNEEEKHNQQSIHSHMALLLAQGSSKQESLNGKIESLEAENRRLQEQLGKMADSIVDLRSASFQSENESNNTSKELKLDIEVLKGEVKGLKQKLVEKEAANAQLSRRVDSMGEQLSTVQADAIRNTRSIKQINAHLGSQQADLRQAMQQDLQRQQSYKHLRNQVDQNTKDVKSVSEDASRNASRMGERISTLELEVQCEATKTNALFSETDNKLEKMEDKVSVTLPSQLGKKPVVMVLRDYAKWQVENNEWKSPPFYLEGYKLCLTAFVNGDPQHNAKGFFSLYVHIMKGEDDHKLSWPFQHTVVLELLHIEDSSKNVEQKVPYDNKMERKYNGRVTGQEERTKGWGFAKFMKHEMLIKFLRGPREILYIRVSLK